MSSIVVNRIIRLLVQMFGPYPAARLLIEPERDAIAYLERQAANAAKVAGSSAASPESRERAVITRQCAERWAQDLRAGMHHGEAAAWAAVLAEQAARDEPQPIGED